VTLRVVTDDGPEPDDPRFDPSIPPGEPEGITEHRVRTEPQPERTQILITEQEHEVVRQSLEVLLHAPDLFQRSNKFVDLVCDSRTGMTRIRELPRSVFRTILVSVVEYMKLKLEKKEITEVHAHPPDWLVSSLWENGEWPGVRSIVGVLESPALRPDGSVLQHPGYDHPTGFFLVPSVDFPNVPEFPTRDDAAQALRFLREPFADFPFASPADAAAPLALVMTLLARPAIRGAVPMCLVDANTRGSGKSLVTDVVGMICNGRASEKTTFRAEPEEQEKTLSSFAIAGSPFVVWDNVTAALSGGALDKALTARDTVAFRVLGRSEIAVLPWRTTMAATGNNLIARGDTARRVYRCRLESDLENPEDRTDFSHSPLLPWVRHNRPDLVVAALTILRAHSLAGRPCNVDLWGSFEEWSAIVPASLEWAGAIDPQLTRAQIQETGDDLREALVTLLDNWPSGDGCLSAADLLERSREDAELFSALEVLGQGRGPMTAHRVSYALRGARGRVCVGKRIMHRKGHGNTWLWYVEEVIRRVAE
jgi:hypothetical protein